MMQAGVSNFLYRSETALRPGAAEVDAILQKARERNNSYGLTGFLHHEDGFFFQWLEGPADGLAMIGSIIDADPRHHAITYLHRGVGAPVEFPDWSMGHSTSEADSLLSWLARDPVAQIERGAYSRSILRFLKQRSLVSAD